MEDHAIRAIATFHTGSVTTDFVVFFTFETCFGANLSTWLVNLTMATLKTCKEEVMKLVYYAHIGF